MTHSMPRLAIYQPDIPQNTGTMLRLAACLGVPVDIIEPAGFDVSDRNLRRSGMDYLDRVEITRHISWRAFAEGRVAGGGRLVLATTKAAVPYADFTFRAGRHHSRRAANPQAFPKRSMRPRMRDYAFPCGQDCVRSMLR